MTYITKDGKKKNSYLLHSKRIDEMVARGWRVKLSDFQETEQELYDRLSKYYGDVRVYESSTRIPGLHDIFAMCR